MNLNYTSNTTVQRQTAINPIAPLATILSQVGYSRDMGPVSLQVGGERRQYPGRPQVDENLPTHQPHVEADQRDQLAALDAELHASRRRRACTSTRRATSPTATARSPTARSTAPRSTAARATRQMTFSTPFKIGDIQVTRRGARRRHRGGLPAAPHDPRSASTPPPARTRVYQRTYLETVDFDLSAGLPQLIKSQWNIAPNVSIANVDPGAYFVRSERTGAAWVSQSKRLSYGLGISPTFYGLFDGFGPVSKWRHSDRARRSRSRTRPGANRERAVSRAPPAVLPTGYLGALAQKQATLSLSTNIEAKLQAGRRFRRHAPRECEEDQRALA